MLDLLRVKRIQSLSKLNSSEPCIISRLHFYFYLYWEKLFVWSLKIKLCKDGKDLKARKLSVKVWLSHKFLEIPQNILQAQSQVFSLPRWIYWHDTTNTLKTSFEFCTRCPPERERERERGFYLNCDLMNNNSQLTRYITFSFLVCH